MWRAGWGLCEGKLGHEGVMGGVIGLFPGKLRGGLFVGLGVHFQVGWVRVGRVGGRRHVLGHYRRRYRPLLGRGLGVFGLGVLEL